MCNYLCVYGFLLGLSLSQVGQTSGQAQTYSLNFDNNTSLATLVAAGIPLCQPTDQLGELSFGGCDLQITYAGRAKFSFPVAVGQLSFSKGSVLNTVSLRSDTFSLSEAQFISSAIARAFRRDTKPLDDYLTKQSGLSKSDGGSYVDAFEENGFRIQYGLQRIFSLDDRHYVIGTVVEWRGRNNEHGHLGPVIPPPGYGITKFPRFLPKSTTPYRTKVFDPKPLDPQEPKTYILPGVGIGVGILLFLILLWWLKRKRRV